MNARSLLATAIVLATVRAASAKPYTVAELKILVGKKSYKEAVEHLADVAPGDRRADWLDVAAAAGAGLLGTLSTDDGTTLAAIDELDRDFPELLTAPAYTKVRGDLGYAGLAGCFAQSSAYWSSYASDQCIRLATRLVDNAGKDAALALRVAKLVRPQSPVSAIAFFKSALAAAGKTTAATCKDGDLGLSVIAGLGVSPDAAQAVDARAMTTTCWDALKDAVVKAFDADAKGGYVRQNTCDLLKAKKLLTPLQEKRCKK